MKRQTTRREDYLKIIEQLSHNGSVRAAEIARTRNVSRPTVCVYLRQLVASGDIFIDAHHNIFLTDQGKAVACSVRDKNRTLYTLLVSLGVPEETAQQDACRLEHALSERSYQELKRLVEGNLFQDFLRNRSGSVSG